MLTFLKRLPQSTIIGLSSLILAALLAASFTFLVAPRLLPHMARAAGNTTCAQSPDATHCNNQDPVAQGCVADAQTTNDFAITYSDVEVGNVQRRYSPTCHSWWGRVFDQRIAATTPLGITVGNNQMISAPPTFVSPNQYRLLYSPMVFVGQGNQPPQVIGTIEVDGVTPFPSTTISAGN